MIVSCLHGTRDNPQPCPVMCPVQKWPRYMFRLAFVGGGWKLRRKYRRAGRYGEDEP